MQPTAAPTPLGQHEDRHWEASPGAYGGRRNRRGGPYSVFIPDRIASRPFELGDEAISLVVTATKELARLNARAPGLASLNALASNLLRSESAASSRIEGLAVSHKRLARAAYGGDSRPGADRTAAEVLGNVKALQRAIELGARSAAFTVDDIVDIHRTLLRFSQDRHIAGVIRTSQNWIGGNDFNPIGAAYVPPPPEHVPQLLDDLCRFIARDDLAAVAQAAIAHAQFENIHPFADGNGRVGRTLIYTILQRRGETSAFIPPISLVLAAEPKAYIGGLGDYSQGRVSRWAETFASATERAAVKAERLADTIEERQAAWLDRLGQPRSDSAVRQLVSALPGQPVVDVAVGRQLTGKSHVAVQNALGQLEEAGILQRLNERKWGRVWECGELFELVESVEEELSTGAD